MFVGIAIASGSSEHRGRHCVDKNALDSGSDLDLHKLFRRWPVRFPIVELFPKSAQHGESARPDRIHVVTSLEEHADSSTGRAFGGRGDSGADEFEVVGLQAHIALRISFAAVEPQAYQHDIGAETPHDRQDHGLGGVRVGREGGPAWQGNVHRCAATFTFADGGGVAAVLRK